MEATPYQFSVKYEEKGGEICLKLNKWISLLGMHYYALEMFHEWNIQKGLFLEKRNGAYLEVCLR